MLLDYAEIKASFGMVPIIQVVFLMEALLPKKNVCSSKIAKPKCNVQILTKYIRKHYIVGCVHR